MSGTRSGLLALLVATAACGSVPVEDEDTPDAMLPTGMTTYQAALTMSTPAMFGGAGTFVCKYTMTLRQIELELKMSTSGQVIGGSARNMTDEKVTNTAECPYLPANPTLQKFTFKSATPVGASTMVVMEGEAANAPKASLAITLTPIAGAFSAASRWTRTDQVPELTWSVTASMMLTVK